MLRVLLVDDEPLALQRMEALLANVADVEIVGSACDGEEAASEVARLAPDLVFLDIRMPKQNGLSLARSLRAVPATEVIFITAFDHFAVEAFEADAVDYLLKPVEQERVEAALVKARRRRAGATASHAEGPAIRGDGYLDGFWIERRKGRVWVPLSVVRWIEAARDYVVLHTDTESYLMRSTMEALDEQVSTRGFLRVSRSAYVRVAFVSGVYKQGNYTTMLALADDTMIRVGMNYSTSVRSYFQALGHGLSTTSEAGSE